VIRPRREIIAEGSEIAETKLIVSGWAARVRHLPDGRRQFLSMILPGDLIGHCRQPNPLAVSTVITITRVALCAAPSAAELPTLARAYAMSGALEEAYLLSHITRVGRLHAQERIADLMLELLERLQLAGLAPDGSFDFPMTQEVVSDALGLTSVHVNRMVQAMRREGDIIWKSGRLKIANPARLARSTGRAATRVSADQTWNGIGATPR
jgi:CRP-like cAMP-binding protein